ncbi:eCIS core domain-containing protein [Nakamurella lactea]|uniref:eCIS core domain-containing protein n=1 Tax=Nakamurella lactea TaxID=459515 RepID=UPI0004044BB4|nr:DUF4157 domain-containing protein [Nakamurella lactea]
MSIHSRSNGSRSVAAEHRRIEPADEVAGNSVRSSASIRSAGWPRPVAGRVQPVAERAHGALIQAKLRVGPASDPAEVEAERVAEAVLARLRAPARQPGDAVPSTAIGSIADQGLLVSRLRSAAGGEAGGELDVSTEAAVGRLTGGGRPLPVAIRRSMEDAFGADLSAVRLHVGPQPRELNDRIGAQAFTVGDHVAFRDGVPDVSSDAGARLMAHELTHVVQQRGGVRRRTVVGAPRAAVIRRRTGLTTKDVVSIISSVPQLKSRLATVLQDERMKALQPDKGVSVQTRIETTLRSYKEHMAKKKPGEDVDLRDAMMLSTALGGIARVFAEELNDPSVTTQLLPLLLQTFEDEVGQKLKKKRRSGNKASRDSVMQLTKALSGGDPVTQYMHREIRKEIAAEQIAAMAAAAGLTPLKILELMTERWQAAMSSYRADQQQAVVKDKAGSFNRAEAHGEYSPYFFERTFGSATPDWEAGGAGGADKLKLTADADQKLAELKAEVTAPSPVTAVNPRAGVTERQERHLAEVERAEAAAPSVDASLLALLADRYLLLPGAAQTLLADIKQFLRHDMKLTVTVNLEGWFGTDAEPKKPSPKFAPANAARATTELKTLFGKPAAAGSITHLPTWDDKFDPTAARGASYLRFRHWKDQLMTGLQDMSGAEMASFGGGNINWETVKGTDNRDNFGANYYGNLHFVLDRTKFASRIVYTAGDHGEPHRDPLLALYDLCTDGKGRTWLKDVKNIAVLDNVVNAVRTKAPLYGMGMKLEFQVFGGINMKKDVEEAVLAPQLGDEALKRVKRFYRGTSVAVRRLKDAPLGGLTGGDGGEFGDVPEFVRVYLAHGDDLDRKQQKTVADVRAEAKLNTFNQNLLVGAFTLAATTKNTAISLNGRLGADDIKTLKGALAKARKMLGAVDKSTVDDELSGRVADEVAAAAKALVQAMVPRLVIPARRPVPAPDQQPPDQPPGRRQPRRPAPKPPGSRDRVANDVGDDRQPAEVGS